MHDENSRDVSVTVGALTFSDGTEIKLNPDDIVVFVGPNNAGKSACLKEIEAHLGTTQEPKNVIKSITIKKIGENKDVYNYIRKSSHESYNNGNLQFSGAGYQINSSIINHSWSNDFKHLRTFFCRRLKTESRITDSDPAPSYSVLDQPATRPIQIIFSDSDVEKRLSGYFKEAFGCDLIVFKGGGTKIPLFVGERITPEQGEDSTSKTFLQRLTRTASPLHEQGDGMRSFASVVLEMLASEAPSILLLDEPEAFLHPPQARLIGEFLAKERRADAQMFIATHSPEVLLGLLNVAPQQLRIIRIQRHGSINKVKELEKEKAKKIASDPLLKFSSVLAGVFHQRAIVCEADADCLFYQALLAQPSVHSGPYPDVLFLYAGGKHRMATIAESLSSLGVPVDVVADIDLLRELNDLKNLLSALNAPSESIEGAWKTVSAAIQERKPWLSAGGIKAEIHKALDGVSDDGELPVKASTAVKVALKKASPWDAIKSAGVTAIPKGDPTKKFKLLESYCKGHGLWIVPVGELEGFCGAVGNKGPKWVQEVIETYDLDSAPELEEARKFISEIWNRSPSLPDEGL